MRWHSPQSSLPSRHQRRRSLLIRPRSRLSLRPSLLKARWWIMAAMYLAVILTIVIAFGDQLVRVFG